MIENFFLFFYLLFSLPKIAIERLRGKRHPDFLQRLGFFSHATARPLIWIHGVSVGEIRAAEPLFRQIRSKSLFFFVTTTTATGMAEAKRSLPEADAFAYLPIDFTWVVRRFVKKLNPRAFILVESDFWPNLLCALKKNGTKIALVSGKMSENSFRRFLFFRRFSKGIFDYFDHVCVQNEEYFDRFSPFMRRAQKLRVTGNLKLDLKANTPPRKLPISGPAITISCTHAPEEELLLNELMGGGWTILLAPRHPERFEGVAQWLRKKKIEFCRLSENAFHSRLILIDAMGQLPACYTASQLAILGGSFIETVGGHNVLEPCLYGTPVIFGPHMFKQQEFAKRVLDANGGVQVPLAALRKTVDRFFADSEWEKQLRQGAEKAIELGRGVSRLTLEAIGGGLNLQA